MQHRDCQDNSLLCAFHALKEITSKLSTPGTVISERRRSPGIYGHIFVILILRYSAILLSHSFKKRQPQMSQYVLWCKLCAKSILIYFFRDISSDSGILVGIFQVMMVFGKLDSWTMWLSILAFWLALSYFLTLSSH